MIASYVPQSRIWRNSFEHHPKMKIFYAALEALGSAIPISLGGLIWIGYKIGAEVIAPLVLALFCAMAITNVFSSRSQRPLIYQTRFFEVSLLVGFIDIFVPLLSSWGLTDTPTVRLTLVMLACFGAALLQPVFYALRLQRITRFIPAPVFAGFLNAVAIVLIISQCKQTLALLADPWDILWPSLLIAATCFVVARVTLHLKPTLPAGMVGLAVASLLAFLLFRFGYAVSFVMPTELQWVLPVALFDWGIFDISKVALGAVLTQVGFTSALLAVVIFLNTITVSETVSQIDDRPTPSIRDTMFLSAGKIISASLGALPVSGSPSPTLAAMRVGSLTPGFFAVVAVSGLLFYALGLLAWTPRAAIIGLLLFVALLLMDRPSMALARRYVFQSSVRQQMSLMQREDLLIVVLVALSGAFVNMVVALLVGMALGLVLFAKRNGKNPIKDVHNGQTWRSNCTRSSGDTALLSQHGQRILSVRLQGALYFGIARSLREELERLISNSGQQRQWMVLDWHAVVSYDTTVAHMMECVEQAASTRGVQILHCDRADVNQAYVDMDRALEVCENQLLDDLRPRLDGQTDPALHLAPLLGGLEPEAQALVLNCFQSRGYAEGERVITKGEHSRDLHVITHGRADVLIDEGAIRLDSMSCGAVFGEMGFLDGTPRTAHVVATEPLVTHVLNRVRFDELSRSHPGVAQQILQNLCEELAKRLRYLHQLISRERA
jgi:SulP family sulfate permease